MRVEGIAGAGRVMIAALRCEWVIDVIYSIFGTLSLVPGIRKPGICLVEALVSGVVHRLRRRPAIVRMTKVFRRSACFLLEDMVEVAGCRIPARKGDVFDCVVGCLQCDACSVEADLFQGLVKGLPRRFTESIFYCPARGVELLGQFVHGETD